MLISRCVAVLVVVYTYTQNGMWRKSAPASRTITNDNCQYMLECLSKRRKPCDKVCEKWSCGCCCGGGARARGRRPLGPLALRHRNNRNNHKTSAPSLIAIALIDVQTGYGLRRTAEPAASLRMAIEEAIAVKYLGEKKSTSAGL